MARTKSKQLAKIKQNRDGGSGAILVLPHCILNSAAYLSLHPHAVRLLIDIAMQLNPIRGNNGSLLCTKKHMKTRGWNSSDMLDKAKQELLDKGFIVQTVQGMRPHKAAWYAVTWCSLDPIDGLEITKSEFPRSAYTRWQPNEANGPSPKKRLVRRAGQGTP